MSVYVGQKWRWTAPSGGYYTKGREYLVLREPDDGGMFIMQDDSALDHPDNNSPHHWTFDPDFLEHFELVNGPVRKVMRTEVVAGKYGLVEIDGTNGAVQPEGVSIWLPRNRRWTAAELRAAAETFNAVAEALSQQSVSEPGA